ncbi:MAG: STAS domain-containing protein [Chloroflexia bacterium]
MERPSHSELLRQIADLRAVNEELRLWADLIEAVDRGIGAINEAGVILYANPAWGQMHGFPSLQEMLGQDFFELVEDGALVRKAVAQTLSGPSWHGEITCRRLDHTRFPAALSLFPLGRSEPILGLFLEDITERRRAEEALRAVYEDQARLREEVITAQRKVIGELSTPVIPVLEGILVLPLVGSVDTERARRITEVVLEEVALRHARVMILDITGVPMVDTAVANALLRTAAATRLLGAETILVGITPAVAQTMIQLGVSLEGLITRADLQSGIEYALQALGRPSLNRRVG